MSLQQLAGQRNAGFQPVVVPNHGHFTRAQALSLSLHIAMIAVLLLPVVARTPQRKIIGDTFNNQPLTPLKWFGSKSNAQGQFGTLSGSGNHDPEPPSKGTPPPFRSIQLMQAAPIANRDAAMMLPPSIFGPEEVRFVQVPADRWGIPTEAESNDSRGPGEGGSFGRGKGRGIGNRTGDGYDGEGSSYGSTRYHSQAVCSYCPNPAFTEEAIRVRWQGTVLLRGWVTLDGRVTNVTIVRGAGMGLDENAIEKVRTWRLTPARGPDGRPAAAWTLIEVVFRQH